MTVSSQDNKIAKITEVLKVIYEIKGKNGKDNIGKGLVPVKRHESDILGGMTRGLSNLFDVELLGTLKEKDEVENLD